MIAWFRRRLVQRVFVALFMTMFLPLAGVAHASQAVCYLVAGDLWPLTTASQHATTSSATDGHGPAGVQPAQRCR